MKYLIDANVLISAILFPNGNPAKALAKAKERSVRMVVCEYTLEELERVFRFKFPEFLDEMKTFVRLLAADVEIMPTPSERFAVRREQKVRDVKDRPVVRAAVTGRAGGIVTGDKDLLESGIKRPQMITIARFLEKLEQI